MRRRLKNKGCTADMPYMTASMRFVSACVVVAMGLSPLWAQSSGEAGSRSKILALEHAWNQAEAFKDLKALDALFDNALIYVDADGTLMNKSDFLTHVKSEHVQQVITQSMFVQVLGGTAIVTGTYQSNEFQNGKPVIRRGRFVDAWILKGTTWVCVAAQATPIR
jgi:hypothetical protein